MDQVESTTETEITTVVELEQQQQQEEEEEEENDDERSINIINETDKLSYEIFSILEGKFLFGYDDNDLKHLWFPNPSNIIHNSSSSTNNSKRRSITSTSNIPLQPTPSSPASAAIKNQRGKVCILSLDGGAGMRGVLTGKVLAHLERTLRSRSSNPDARISDYFDVAAGTGVGGILISMLFATKDGGAHPLYHAEDTWRFLADKGHRFFRNNSSSFSQYSQSHQSCCSSSRRSNMVRRRLKRPSRFSSSLLGCLYRNDGGGAAATAGLERSLKEAFGEKLTLRDTVKPVLIPCYDLRSSAPFLFSRADALEEESYNFRLWEVCRATWAEPWRFEPTEMSSVDGATRCVGVDGGLAMSNPTAAAITHVLHNKQEFPFVRGVEDLMVLSVGTGSMGGGGGDDGNGNSNSGSNANVGEKRWRAKDWVMPVSRIASDGAADFVDNAVSMSFANSRNGGNYVRIQLANGWKLGDDGGDALDSDPSPNNVKKLSAMAEEMLQQKNVESILFGGMKRVGEHSNSERVDWFARELITEHQRRSCRIAPTVAFKQQRPPQQPQPPPPPWIIHHQSS